tara:strand:- start:37 stop:990 length:954 start_codon:yes stop_codon:yes gene_type:complete
MELFNYRKYIAVVVLGYFSIKIYYSFLFENIQNLKCSNKELVDFSITCVLASLVYILTNFNYVMMNSVVYYIGFLIGTQSVVLKEMLLDTIEGSNLQEFLTYLLLIIYGVVFIYFYVIKNLNSSIINPMLMIVSIISLVIGLLLTTQKKTKGYKLLTINPNMGFISFIGSMLIIHTEENNIILAFFQSILIGSFVSYFSYYEPQFILDTKRFNSNISIIDFSELVQRMIKSFNTEDTNTEHTITKIFQNFINDYSKKLDDNLTDINTKMNLFNEKENKLRSIENEIKTNKIVSGLSYITILIVVTISYINFHENNLI